jgi:multidrug efflux system outer membrane protein
VVLLPVAGAWPQGAAYGPAQGGGDQALFNEAGWKAFFADPRLQALIAQALANNRDLLVATLNIEIARAGYRVSSAALLPQVDAGASATVEHNPRDVSTTGYTTTTQRFDANLAVTAFELDLFGRLHSLRQQALEQYLATTEARSAAQIALVAEVANAWIALLADRRLLELSERTAQSRERSLDLTERSAARGIGTQVDVAQARGALETVRATRQLYLRQVAQDRNALELLVGAPLDQQDLAAEAPLERVRVVEDLPVDLPSRVMLRRPDIAAAEHALLAQNANIGAARAAFFPDISLTGALGTASQNLGSLFLFGAWSFLPQVSAPVFDAGRNQASLDSAKASRDIAIAQYEKAIQTAFREVSDALAARGTLTAQLAAQQAAVAANQEAWRLASARYERGVDSYLVVLDAERNLFVAQQAEIVTMQARLANFVNLYKTLGGGK